MNADDLASLLRLLGFPLWIYGLVALLLWNKRTEPKPQETPRAPYHWPDPEAGKAPQRSVLKALRSADQRPKPQTRVLVCFMCGMLMTLVGLIIGIAV